MLVRALIILLFAFSVSAMDKPIRILPLGDSITQGGRNDRAEYTYRYPLFCMLKDAGVKFDFVGSLNKGLHGDAKWPDYKGEKFDPDHEGHYGWKTGKVYEKLPGWMKKYPSGCDIALIHLGTNDQGSKDFDKDIIEPLKGIVKLLREKNPKVKVLIGHLNFNGGAAIKIRPLVEKMAEEISTTVSPVKTVHFYKGWMENPKSKGADTFDWAHPNPQGQKKMAEKWFEAMKEYLK